MALEFHQTTLDNGLTIIAETTPDAHSAAAGFFVRTGARDEDPAVMGVSHFLEHMMFKGTDLRTAEDVDRDFDDIGANHNAFTTSEMTAFWCHTLPEHLTRGCDILADIMRPAIREPDFNDEKKVILEEIAMYRDQPFWELYERAMEIYYGEHPLSHRVLGTEDTVGDMVHERMVAYFNDRYSADNTVIALAGNVDFDAMVDRFAETCAAWKSTGTARAFPAIPNVDDELTLKSSAVNRHYMLMLAPAPAIEDDRRYAASILAQILGDQDGSRFYWALIETGLADEALAQYDPRDGTGNYMIYASCSPEDAEEIEAVARREIDNLIASVTEDDLLRTRRKVATAVALAGELPSGRMRRLGRQWTYTQDYRPLEEELTRIDAVTLDELRSVHEAFPLTPKFVGRLTPGE